MPTINVNGIRTAYQRTGNGAPLVLLHGILQDSRSWSRQFRDLAEGFDVIVPDLPGCGQSSDPSESDRFPAYGRWLAGFFDTLGLTSVHVGGLSWGGILAIELYRQRPDLVRSLILADTYAGWKGSLPPAVVAERLNQCLRESEMPGPEFIPVWMPGLLTPAAPPSLRDEVSELMAAFHPLGYRSMAHSVAEADLRHVLPTIAVPTLLLWGEKDARSPMDIAHTFHDSIPGSTLVVIPESGHVSNVESPDAFNAAIRSFLGT